MAKKKYKPSERALEMKAYAEKLAKEMKVNVEIKLLDPSPCLLPELETLQIDDAIQIVMDKIEIDSLRGKVEVDGFIVGAEVNYPGNRDEPPSSDFIEFESFQSYRQAVVLAFNKAFEDRIRNAQVNLSYAEMAEEEDYD